MGRKGVGHQVVVLVMLVRVKLDWLSALLFYDDLKYFCIWHHELKLLDAGQLVNKYLLHVYYTPDNVLGGGGYLGEQDRQGLFPK